MSTRLELLKRYMIEDPEDSFLRYAIALELIAVNNYSEAYNYLEKLLIDDAEYLAAYYQAGKTAEALGQKEKAQNWYIAGIEVARRQNDRHTLQELEMALESIFDA